MRTLLNKNGTYMYETYGHEDGNPTGYIEIPSKIRVLDKDWFFTGRIKYYKGKNSKGEYLGVRIYFEIRFTKTSLVKERRWGSNEYKDIERVLWVSSDMFTFDFSDEYTEEIYQC